jgi:hypothetical protein
VPAPQPPHPVRRSAGLARAALAGVTAGILALTLMPVDDSGPAARLALEITAVRFGADAAANTLLFIPFGLLAALCLAGARPVALGAALSLFIEVAQLGIAGRYTSPSDVVFNTAGAAVGMLLVRRAESFLWPVGWHRRALQVGATAAALAILGGGPLLFAPAVPRSALYGQWTAEFGDMSRYDGQVLAADAGGLPLPSSRIARSDRLRAALLAGDTLSVRFSAGPPPPSLAPIFSIYDERAREVLLIGADGHDLFVRYRMRAGDLLLDQPDFRVRGALRGVAPERPVLLRFWRDGANHCLALNRTRQCGLGFTAAHTWALLLYPLLPALAAVMPFLWLAALLAPAGFWARRPGPAAASAGLAVVALLATPHFAPVLPATPLHFAAALMGSALGYAAGRAVETRARPPARVPQGGVPSRAVVQGRRV